MPKKDQEIKILKMEEKDNGLHIEYELNGIKGSDIQPISNLTAIALGTEEPVWKNHLKVHVMRKHPEQELSEEPVLIENDLIGKKIKLKDLDKVVMQARVTRKGVRK